MAKLKSDPIGKEDILEYLENSSDFAFEVSVLKKLTELGFTCEHAGTYEDPITGKTREFDIRARKSLVIENDFRLELVLSVECKNLRENFPLIVHCMPRQERECYLDLVWAAKPESYIPPYRNARAVTLLGKDSPYEQRMANGKSCDQVGRRDNHSAEILGNDSDVFEKISQSINAGYQLIKEAHYSAEDGLEVATIILPILVVPNDRVWSIWYGSDGKIVEDPKLEKNIEYFIGKSWLVGDVQFEISERYFFSHLEIVQIDSILDMLSKYTLLPALESKQTFTAMVKIPK